jgi:hypothetical protein
MDLALSLPSLGKRTVRTLHDVIGAVTGFALEALFAAQVKQVAFDGDLAIILVHTRQLDPHDNILRRFFEFAGQQTPTREDGKFTAFSLFVLAVSEMREGVAAAAEQFMLAL